MRILLIDNGVARLDALQAACSKHEVRSIRPEGLADIPADSYDAVIVAGDYRQGLVWDKPYFLSEIELLRMTDKPVLGIGLGFELICYAYGCQLHEMAERTSGAASIVPTADGAKLFQGSDPIKVLETERWAVYELPKVLQVLARSDSGIEAVRHKTKVAYGLQLGIEDFKYLSDGDLVFANILDGFVKTM